MSEENLSERPANVETPKETPTQSNWDSFQMPYFFDALKGERPREPNSFDTFRADGAPMSVDTPQRHGECYVATVYRESTAGRDPVAFVQVDEVEESLCVHVVVRGLYRTLDAAQIRAALEYALGTYTHINFPQ